MTREQVKSIFADATDEQIKSLLDIHSGDIGKAKAPIADLQAKLDTATADLTAAKSTITQLEASKGDVEKLQKEIDDFKAAEKQRNEAAAAAAARAAIETRFDAVAKGKTFVHDMVRSGVLGDFEKALADKANVGRSDADVFGDLVKDKGYFKPENGGGEGMGGARDDLGGGDDSALSDADYYAKVFAKNNK